MINDIDKSEIPTIVLPVQSTDKLQSIVLGILMFAQLRNNLGTPTEAVGRDRGSRKTAW